MNLSYEELALALSRAEQDLHTSERRVRALLESLPVGLLSLADGDRIEFGNASVEQLFGYSHRELRGKELKFLFPELGVSLAELRVKPRRSLELVGETASGERFPAQLFLADFESDRGGKVLVAVQDITERQQLERAKQEFFAMVTHDLRTPLTSLHVFLQMLEGGDLGQINTPGKRSLELAQSSVGRLLDMVSDLLDSSRMEAGEIALNLTAVQLSKVVEEAVGAVEPFAARNKIKIEWAPLDVQLVADFARLVRVVINLLSNAIKFSPQESEVTIELLDQTDSVELRVIDRGKGIAPQHHALVFEKYKQVDPEAESKIKGSGLGLPICKAIIEQHNGVLGLQSEPGKGSLFFIRLPKRQPADQLT